MNHKQKILIRNEQWPLEACLVLIAFEGGRRSTFSRRLTDSQWTLHLNSKNSEMAGSPSKRQEESDMMAALRSGASIDQLSKTFAEKKGQLLPHF